MIDPHWDVIDLDPVTWRNIGRFIDVSQYVRAAQPGEHGLFIVHDRGRVLKVLDTQHRASVKVDRVVDARALAKELYAHGQWDRVHIIDQRHLARVGSVAGASANRSLHLDGYYQLVHDLIWDGSDGYVAEPAKPDHWNYWKMGQIEQFVSRLPKSASIALGVFEGGQLKIGLVLEFKQGNIVRVTTFEAPALQPIAPHLSADFLDHLWQQLANIAPPAAVLLCEQKVFDEWIAAEDKLASLAQAVRNGTAWLRLIDQDAPALAAIG
ncbi:MAG TPA: hypothetical protein VMP08_09185 [Anaerolineae bacterium]|nr:hypothetical protein [Anaerolineae bacterium]